MKEHTEERQLDLFNADNTSSLQNLANRGVQDLNNEAENILNIIEDMKDKRHYCSYCKKKRKEEYMTKVYYFLLHRYAWHCDQCFQSRKEKGLIYAEDWKENHGQE